MTSQPVTGTPEVPTPSNAEFVVAMLAGEGLVVDPRTGRLPRVSGVDWPDHRQRTLGHASAVPVAPLGQVAADPAIWVFPMALRDGWTDAGPTCPLSELDTLDEDADVIAAARTAVGPWRGDAPFPDRRPGWFRPGWWPEVEAWVDEQLTRLGRPRTGPLRTVKFWSLSAVLEVPTAAGAAYVKATCDWFRQEARITQAVAGFAPHRVPTLLAVDADRAWMLMDPLPGDPDQWPRPPGTVAATARALAEVQLASVEHLHALVDAGCPDRCEKATLRALGTVLRDGVEVSRLDPGEREALLAAEPRLVETVRRFYDCGLPTVLSHGDLHLGNVAAEGAALVFYDWTDACLSHPFLDAAHLAENARESESGDEEEVWSAYLPAWRAAAPRADLDLARRLAPRVDTIFQAITYEGIYRAQEEAALQEMAGEELRLLRSLLGWADDTTGR